MQIPKKHTNELINETSPYLQQHAHNPVDWHGWNRAALAKAKTEEKPILLSIGYSACHWCHVMEHESFEDEHIAAIMNENFVNIKVDMEERPDIDKIYMRFVQLTTGSGGWPLTVFLTPDQLPFFGGTYFPPNPRFNMPSFEQILTSVAEAYRVRRDEITHSAKDVLAGIKGIADGQRVAESFTDELLDSAFHRIIETFDNVNGGFGGAPKFPAPMTLEFLLRYYKRTGHKDALEVVVKTCNKMARGGIYDQLGGGFHRYSVDTTWMTPHFEKMLYDNAQLARIYVHLFQVTRDDFYKEIAIGTLDYIKREMLDENGGFFSAQDADSEGEEGKFFVWKPAEIAGILGEDDAKFFEVYFDVSDFGNFEGKNILNVKRSIKETAEEFSVSEDLVMTSIETSKVKLFEARAKRIKPFRDEKILTAWNGLMLATFAEASAVFESAEYLITAKSNADFLIRELQDDGRLLRTWIDGKAKLNAYIEDYANLADGLFELFQASGESKYLFESKRLVDVMIEEFWDEESGGFYFTSNDHDELLVRSKDYFDNATPSGNSAAADVLLKLSKIFGDEKYERIAVLVLRIVAPQIRRHPGAFGRCLSAIDFYLSAVKEIVVIGDRGNELEKELWRTYDPNKVVIPVDDPNDHESQLKILSGKKKIDGKATAFICEKFACKKPVTELSDLRRQIL